VVTRLRTTVVASSGILALVCGLAGAPLRLGAQEGPAIRGRVVDAITGRPIPGADVTLEGWPARVSTAADGTFVIGNLPTATYTVTVLALGYAPRSIADAELDAGVLEILLDPAAIPLSEITVSPGTFAFGELTPRQTMSRAELDAVPQIAEDVFRAVNRLPGITSPDFTARFSIRGARPDETLIRIDGLEIYEPYHLKDFQDGAVSIIDAEIVDNLELMTGGWPVRYGNYNGGVFNIRTREPADSTRYGFGLSLINLRAFVEGRFAGGRGSYLVSARRGYLDIVLKALGESGIPSPSYHDVLGKVKYRFGEGHSLGFSVLQAHDRWTFDTDGTTGYLDTIQVLEQAHNDYGHAYAWLTHDLLLGQRATVRTIASAGRNTEDRNGGEYYASDNSPLLDVVAVQDFDVFSVKQDWVLDVTSALALEAGAEFRRVETDYSSATTVNQDPDNPYPDTAGFFPNVDSAALKTTGSTFGAYLAARVRPVRPLTIEVGARYDGAGYTGDSDFSPRVNALVALGDRTDLRLSWGVFRQMQALWEVSILDPTQTYYPSERSLQWTASVEHRLGGGELVRIEAYRRDGDHLRPVYRNWKGGIDVFPESEDDRIFVTPTESVSRGVELYVQKNFTDRLSLRGGYALAQVREHLMDIENVNQPVVLDFAPTHGKPHDQRHAVNLDVTWRPWQSWSLSTAYTFHTGWPTTLQHTESFTDPDGETGTAIRPDPIYGARLPSYHRLDARLTKRTSFWGGDARIFFEVSNLTNHTNVFGYDYFREPTTDGSFVLGSEPEGGFVILPSLGVSWTGWW
jgi:hypothetical protein